VRELSIERREKNGGAWCKPVLCVASWPAHIMARWYDSDSHMHAVLLVARLRSTGVQLPGAQQLQALGQESFEFGFAAPLGQVRPVILARRDVRRHGQSDQRGILVGLDGAFGAVTAAAARPQRRYRCLPVQADSGGDLASPAQVLDPPGR